ncbi:MAG: ComEC family competence protein [Chitinophagales bacterium]|nr:ComEC family competence protein [Chitinophagales bacterium]
MIEWKSFPFVRFLIPFIIGILAYVFGHLHISFIVLVLNYVLCIFLHLIYKNKKVRAYRNGWITGLGFQVCLFLSGNEIAFLSIDQNRPEHYTHFYDKGNAAIVRLLEPPIEKNKSFKVTAEVLSIGQGSYQHSTCGKAILYLQKDTAASKLYYGNILLIKNAFQAIPPPKNPDEFDYKKFLYFNNIYASAYLKKDNWKLLPINQSNPLFDLTFWLRDKSIEAFQKYIPDTQDAAVTEALVVGYRDKMSFDIMQSYAAAGVIHVLAVSGLHVALLFSLLNRMLFILEKKRYGKQVKSLIIIILIWTFALLTGLSGSVVRAAMMFTFFTIGKNSNRTISTLNMLACSAFIILMFKPLLITDVGFQLSYIAVLGISELFPHINRWLYRTNKTVDFIWKTIAVSLAAQIATLPLTVFYFSQFPAYFLFANLLVIPLSALVLYTGIALAVFQIIQPLAKILGSLTYGMVHFLNYYIGNIRELPFSVLYLSSSTIWQSLLFATFILLLIRLLITREKLYLFGITITICILFIISAYNLLHIKNEKSITVYSFVGKSCLEFNNGGNAVAMKSDSLFNEQEQFYLRHHWQLSNTTITDFIPSDSASDETAFLQGTLWNRDQFFQFYNYRLLKINKKLPFNSSSYRMKLNAVIISGNADVSVNEITSWFDTPLIIYNGDNSTYRLNKWMKECNGLHIDTYNVASKGALKISL